VEEQVRASNPIAAATVTAERVEPKTSRLRMKAFSALLVCAARQRAEPITKWYQAALFDG
jgi:hypothetical protein